MSETVQGAAAGSTPAGWYPDPSASGSQRWWDGQAWTAHVTAAAAAAPTATMTITPNALSAARSGSFVPAIRLGKGRSGPPSRATFIVTWAVVALIVVSAVWHFVSAASHVSVSVGAANSAADQGAVSSAPVSPAAAVRADVTKMAAAEETVFARDHRYVQVHHPSSNLFINNVGVQMSAGDTVTVGVRADEKGFCARVSGHGLTALYISDKGGAQPASVSTCPATYPTSS
jgi:Protein of unknown function (DUF2510)